MKYFAAALAGLPLLVRSEFVDCVGQVLTDEDCAWKEGGYTKCTDWVGDGTCDGGFTVSDKLKQLYLNCKEHEFDGGDCEDGAVATCEGETLDGECKAPGDGEIVDCWGQILTDDDCKANVDGVIYNTCEDWKGDGSCDAGQYYSDALRPINFNCEAHDYDGGDCKTPTEAPTFAPTPNPSHEPTPAPTPDPSHEPTPAPTPLPSPHPTYDPTLPPTYDPSVHPTPQPTHHPTPVPSYDPTEEPTPTPTFNPTDLPTKEPTAEPTGPPEDVLVDRLFELFDLRNQYDEPYEFSGCWNDERDDVERHAWVHGKPMGDEDYGKAYVYCDSEDPVVVSGIHITNFGTSITKIDKKVNAVLRQFPNLRTIGFKSNSLKTLGTFFRDLPKLEVLDLTKNSISKVEANALFGNFELKELHMDKNKIKKQQPPVAFLSQNVKLEYFSMSSNKMKQPLWGRTFWQNVNLKYLDLSGNKWKKIHPHLLFGLFNLEVLDISGHKDKTLSGNFFETNGALHKLNFDKVPFKCQPELPPLGVEWTQDKNMKPGGDYWEENLENPSNPIMWANVKKNAKECDLCLDTLPMEECLVFKIDKTCGQHREGECECTCHPENQERSEEEPCYDIDGADQCQFVKSNSMCAMEILAQSCKDTCGGC